MANEIGLVGIGEEAKKMAINIASKGISLSLLELSLNDESQYSKDSLSDLVHKNIHSVKDLQDVVTSLSVSRLVLLMLESEDQIDEMIEKILPLLDEGDSIIDASNSFYKDTDRRSKYLAHKKIHFVGMGVSRGEATISNGPSIMSSGSDISKLRLLPYLKKIAAETFNEPCVSWLSGDGAGHFVKMVQDGIERADMQMISEIYGLCRFSANMSNVEIADLFEKKLINFHDSYLVKITVDILRRLDDDTNALDTMLDISDNLDTGKWIVSTALELGVAVPSITAAINQRIISSYKSIRDIFSKNAFKLANVLQAEVLQDVLAPALLAGRLTVLAEGFHLMQVASDHYQWNLNLEEIAKIWRGGCTISSTMLPIVVKAYQDFEVDETTEKLEHLFLDETFQMILNNNIIGLSGLLSSIQMGSDFATPCLSAAHNYARSLGSEKLPINLIQAQENFISAHIL